MSTSFRWKRAFGGVLVASALATGGMAALSPMAQASTGGTLYVNASTGTDSGTCRLLAHPCQTIAYALTQVTKNSTIKVAVGDYPQPLKITQPVTIIGAGHSGGSSTATLIDPSSLITDTHPNNSEVEETIVDVPGTTNVHLKDLEISGANAQGNFTGCGTGFVGAYYHNSTGSMSSVQVTEVELPQDLFGCQQGLAVYVASDTGMTSSVNMSGLNVNNYEKNGVTCNEIGTTCSLKNSTITGIGATAAIGQNGFEGYNATSITLSGDKVKDNTYTGGGNGNQAAGLLILDVGTVTATNNHLTANDVNGYFGSDGGGPAESPWTISGNLVKGATDKVPGGEADYGWGIQLDSTSNAVSLTNNTVTGSAEYGIAVTGATDATLNGNTANANGNDGIYVGGPGSTVTGSTGNTIENNTTNYNKVDGIYADTSSTANTFSANSASGNVRYDLEDAGTADIWTGNLCTPAHDSNPAGLCS